MTAKTAKIESSVEFEAEPMPSFEEPEPKVLAPAQIDPPRRVHNARRKAKDINADFLQDMGYPTPLEFLVGVYSDDNIPRAERMDAAKAAAPYVHAKLNAVDINANVTVSHEDALDFLDEVTGE